MSSRLPPHSLEAERSALGSVFIKPSSFAVVSSALLTDDFFLPAHREIFAALAAVEKRRQPLDPISVSDELKTRGTLSRLEGGEEYLMRLSGEVPTAENVAHYARLVKEKSQLRKLIAAGAEIQARAYATEDANALVSESAAAICAIATSNTAGLRTVGDFMPGVLEEISRRAQSNGKNEIVGVQTGVTELDMVLGGLRPGNLTVFAADPGGGKTALAVQTALNLCLLYSGTALVFNLEMTAAELAERCAVHQAQVNSQSVRSGQVEYEEFRRLSSEAAKLGPLPMYLEDRAFDMATVSARSRSWRARHPGMVGLLVLDYLQLMRSRGGDDQHRALEIGTMVSQCKELGKELGVAFILVSQFNRGPAQQGREPKKSDLKDSSSIEQGGDQIVLLHNPEQTEDGQIDLIVDKNRHGPCRKVRARWIGRYYRFEDA